MATMDSIVYAPIILQKESDGSVITRVEIEHRSWLYAGLVPGLSEVAREQVMKTGPGAPELADPDCMTVYWSLAGEGAIHTQGGSEVYSLRPGCSVAVPAGMPHVLAGPCSVWMISLFSAAGEASSGHVHAADSEVLELMPTSHANAGREGLSFKKVHLRNGDIPGILQLSQAFLHPGNCVESHVHVDAAELYIALKGAFHLVSSSASDSGEEALTETDHLVEPGQLLVVNPGTQHRVWTEEECVLVMLLFSAPSTST
eukprot:TRINITY_DN25239_c0_g1_i1.p1 TRINITY_DN25239_c0_g1~~TRINITY_DN25239_c0_g1_i1.p1  ORF type:complete len:258 (-),score=46.80 TRINITY_DN25239_c0_g1_i1:266-1039(-)